MTEHEVTEECVTFVTRIVALIDNELTATEIDDVRVHIDACGPCLESYELQRVIKSVVSRTGSDVAPAELHQRVRLTIEELRLTSE